MKTTSMRPYKHNSMFRTCRVLLLALFLAPCLACGDAGAAVLAICHSPTAAATVSPHEDSHLHVSSVAPECACLSDAGKLRSDSPVWTSAIAEGVLPAFSWTLPEPETVPAPFIAPTPFLSRVLAREATSDRAPPSA